MRKILAFTSNRSEYDLLSYLYRYLSKDPEIDFRLLVSGAHLSSTFGMTVRHIEKDGLKILDRIETLLDSDSDAGRIKSASLLLQNAIHSVQRFSPDLILYAGDREDVMIAALLGGYLKIPTAHFFAGDHDQDGLIDNPVRHAASKLSAYQFVSLDEHKARLQSIGENPARIFVIGSCALDKFRYEPALSREDLFSRLTSDGRCFDRYAMVIFHPLMDFEEKTVRDLGNILEALKTSGIPAVVNVPNIDPGARKLMDLINAQQNVKNILLINNLERNLFVNVYRHAAFQIGNSSSGILEAASVPAPVINVGERMLGRKSQENVVFTDGSPESIGKAVALATSEQFIDRQVKGIRNIYGDGDSSRKAYEIIKGLDLSNFAEFRKEDPLLINQGQRENRA
jgi:UDP-hydrolysing UDP-N-acetyl-D-glucosamine 2-epimerase